MNITRCIAVVTLLGAATMMTACETTNNTGTFSGSEVGRAQSVQLGMAYTVRDVSIQNAPSRVGTATGAALGGIAGSSLGSSNRAHTAGAVAGGAAANAVTRSTTPGVEVTVRLDSNQLMSVVQADSPNEFRVGDAVRVTSDGVTTRVVRN